MLVGLLQDVKGGSIELPGLTKASNLLKLV